ncbi:Uncharacterised protein [Ectopseudomonas oleovorans]|uniref:Uncharacterized protein n=1 Tax=Ectopseudomonas oleovorans TaxID=301 RepID=A0A379K1P8_ECTOL|nr:hypothetical protein [Pseudomonas oleovorans]SUD57991.1 Uncharacterised protein [Pseudomonas oleovorans]
MATHSDDEDFRGRKKQARLLGYDAEAWIKAKREEREQFKALEGKDMDGLDKLARDPHMDAIQKAHQERQAALDASHEKADSDKAAAAGQREKNERTLVLMNEISELEKQVVQGNEQTQDEAKQGRSM